MTMHRYQPRSPLQAVDPQAFFGLFSAYEEPENDERDDATVVTIRGPLSQYSDNWEDSYEAIVDRVEVACQQSAPTVALRIDSPGGDVAGLFDAARAIRDACDRAQKQLVVHVGGQCCSAAYALACVADRIVASRTAEVGSIGVIAARIDESRALENMGVTVSLITSGERKADGHTCIPMSEDEQAEFQSHIDLLASEFFGFVAEHRPIEAKAVSDLEAATFRGDAALKLGLIDELGSFDNMIASLGAEAGVIMADEDQKARDALTAIAEDEERDEESRARARRALAALDAEDEDEEESSEDEDEEESSECDEKSEDDEDAEDDEDEKAKARSARTVSARTAAEIAASSAKLERRLAKLERKTEAEDRARLIKAHGGVTGEMAKILRTKPLAEVRSLLAALPQPKKPKLGDHAATTTVGGTRGADQHKTSRLEPEATKAMRRAMGLERDTYGVVTRGNVQVLGAKVGSTPAGDRGES